jgi:predicted DNA binding protein
MWVAKIKLSEEGTLIGSKAIKHKITIIGMPLSFQHNSNEVIVNVAGTIFGDTKNKINFYNDLKREKRTLNLERNKDFIIGTIIEPKYTELIYNHQIIHTSPAIISDKGYEIITIGCFDRLSLNKAVNAIRDNLKGEIIFIKNQKISSASITTTQPELTNKQKNAINLAIKNGYYNSPRKIDLKQLAKLANLSFSTYQVHLRKAEHKVIPNLF